MVTPPDADVDYLRKISSSAAMATIATSGQRLEHIVSLVEITKRGIRNQETPHLHEVSIDSDRLLAMAYSLATVEKKKVAIKNNDHFFSESEKWNICSTPWPRLVPSA